MMCPCPPVVFFHVATVGNPGRSSLPSRLRVDHLPPLRKAVRPHQEVVLRVRQGLPWLERQVDGHRAAERERELVDGVAAQRDRNELPPLDDSRVRLKRVVVFERSTANHLEQGFS
jgi:hypothetical protein